MPRTIRTSLAKTTSRTPHEKSPARKGMHKMLPTDSLRHTLALLFALACLCTTSARACPEGTVFSAYNGNGICAYVGQGAKVAVQCTQMVNSCPSGTSREHKTRGDTGYYCCSKTIANEQPVECVWRGRAPFCNGSCGSTEQFMGAAHDRDSAQALGSTRDFKDSFGKPCGTGSKALCCHHTG